MRNIICSLLLIFFISIVNISAIQSPIRVDNPRVTSSFGEFRTDHFHNGIDIGGYLLNIYPIDNGEIIYYYDETDDPTRMMFGVGNAIIVEHENQMRSYYYHAEPNTVNKEIKYATTNDVIALTGNSGRSGGAHLHLTIEDMNENKVIDPLFVVGDYKDDRPPMIWGIYLRTDTTLVHIREGMNMRYNGEIRIFVKANDLLGNIPLGIKNIEIYMNDTLMREYNFEELIIKNNVYYVKPDYKFEDVYGVDSHFYRGGTFTPRRGQYKFRTVVTDFGDNTVELTRHVNFY